MQNIVRGVARDPDKAPYKFLTYYGTADRDIFYGRDEVIDDLAGKIGRHRCVIVNGASGSGKTSLINAGLIPRLANQGFLYVLFRDYDDPLRQVQAYFARDEHFGLGETAGASLLDLLASLKAKTSAPVAIVFDQFERFFVSVEDEATRRAFVSELRACLADDATLADARFVFAMREEFLGRFVIELEREIPDFWINASHLNLEALASAQARAAIITPLKDLPVGYDADFVDEVLLPDLTAHTDGAGRIEPAHLQIVCSQLYDEIRRRRHADIEAGAMVRIDRALYESLGSTRGILQEYLDKAVASSVGDDRDAAADVRSLLKLMIQPSGTRRFAALDGLAEALGDRDRAQVESLLAKLVDRRVVEMRRREGDLAFSLSHEFMVDKVLGWYDEREMRRRKAEETLARGLAEQQSSGSLLAREQVDLIRAALPVRTLDERQRSLVEQSEARLEAEARRRREQQRRVTYWRRLGLAGMVTLSLASIGIGVWGWLNEQEAARNLVQADKNRALADLQLQRALETREEADRVRHQGLVMLGTRYLLDRDYAAAREMLGRTDERLRGWESGYLMARTLQAHAVVPEVDGVELSLADERPWVVASPDSGRASLIDVVAGTVVEKLPYGGVFPDGVSHISRDGRYVLMPDGKVFDQMGATYYDLERGSVVRTGMRGVRSTSHGNRINATRIAPDGRQVVTVQGTNAYVWDPFSDAPPRVLEGHEDLVIRVAFSGDGRRLATSTRVGEVKVWDTSDWSERVTRSDLHRAVMQLEFDHAGARLLGVDADGQTVVWDVEAGRPPRMFSGAGGLRSGARISPDGRLVAIALPDSGLIEVVDLTMAGEPGGKLEGHGATVTSVAFAGDGLRLATGDALGTVKVWRFRETPGSRTGPRRPPWAEVASFGGHEGRVRAVAFTPDDRFVVSVGADATVRVWGSPMPEQPTWHWLREEDAVNPNERAGPREQIDASGTRLVRRTLTGHLEVWDLATRRQLWRAPLPQALETFTSVRLSADGSRVLIMMRADTALLWNGEDGRSLCELPDHAGQVATGALSGDGAYAAMASTGELRVWATGNCELVDRLTVPGYVRALGFAPGSRKLLVAADKQFSVWSKNYPGSLVPLDEMPKEASGFAFDRDGGRVALWGERTVRVRDLATGASVEVASMQHEGIIWDVQFSPDGLQVATASWDDTARLWDAATGEPGPVLEPRAGDVSSVRFSPDGLRVITGTQKGTVTVFDRADGTELLTLPPPPDARGWYRPRFSRDGRSLLVQDKDGAVAVWTAAPYRDADLPGSADETWEERVEQWNRARYEAKFSRVAAR